jgi:hypothetical protein
MLAACMSRNMVILGLDGAVVALAEVNTTVRVTFFFIQ